MRDSVGLVDEHQGYGDDWDRAVKATDVLAWVEASWVKSTAALIVGTLATVAVLSDVKALKVVAGVCGMFLPAAHLILLRVRKRLLRRMTEQGKAKRQAQRLERKRNRGGSSR